MRSTHAALLLSGGLLIAACSDSNNLSVPPAQDQPPTVSAVGDRTVTANSPEERILFSVSDDVTPAGDINVVVEADQPGLFTGDGISLAGAGDDRELVFTPAQGVIGMTSITITASDSAGQSTSVSFLLSIAPQQLAFSSTLRAAFAADENDEPVTLNDKELDQNEDSYDDLLRD